MLLLYPTLALLAAGFLRTMWHLGEAPESQQPDPDELRRFAGDDSGPVPYSVAAASGSLLIRTGPLLYCVRIVPARPANP